MRRETRRGHFGSGLGLLLALFGLAGCAGGLIPVFDAAHTIGGPVLLLEPYASLRGGEPGEAARIGRVLEGLLRQQLGAHAIELRDRPEGETAELRRAMVRVLLGARSSRRRPLPAGTPSGLDRPLLELVPEGGVALARVVRKAPLPRPGEAALPPRGDPFERPEDRPDYRVPVAGRDWAGIEVELLIVGGDGRVVLHRRLAHPARREQEVMEALPGLVRELARGLRPPR